VLWLFRSDGAHACSSSVGRVGSWFEPSQRLVRFGLRFCAFDSRFVSLLFPTDDCVGKSLRSTVEICHVERALRLVGHLHLFAEW
jgi:hypothetical protein